MTGFIRERVEYQGASWYADCQPLADQIDGLCRARKVQLRIRVTTALFGRPGPVLAEWYSGGLPLADRVTNWQGEEQRLRFLLERGRLVG